MSDFEGTIKLSSAENTSLKTSIDRASATSPPKLSLISDGGEKAQFLIRFYWR